MSGIAGMIEADGHRPPDGAMLRAMAAAMRHRGPDGEAVIERGGLGLIVRRLALVDLRTKNILPANEDQSIFVAFQGLLTNAPQLRAELEAKGHRLASGEDAALVPHLFPGSGNRRSSPRVVLGIPIAYRFGNTIAAALTLNISRGGLAVRTTNPLAVGTAVKVRFRLPTTKKDVDTEATIAWTDRRLGMGLKFTKLTQADQAHIDDYIQGHFFSNRKA